MPWFLAKGSYHIPPFPTLLGLKIAFLLISIHTVLKKALYQSKVKKHSIYLGLGMIRLVLSQALSVTLGIQSLGV